MTFCHTGGQAGGSTQKCFLRVHRRPLSCHPRSQEEFQTKTSPAACVEDPGASLELTLPHPLPGPRAILFPLMPRECHKETSGKTTVPRSPQCCTQSYLKQHPPLFLETFYKPSCWNDGLSSPSAGLQMRRAITPLGYPNFHRLPTWRCAGLLVEFISALLHGPCPCPVSPVPVPAPFWPLMPAKLNLSDAPRDFPGSLWLFSSGACSKAHPCPWKPFEIALSEKRLV